MLGKTADVAPAQGGEHLHSKAAKTLAGRNRASWIRFAVAMALAAISDVIAFWAELFPPVQWALDLVTAILLYLVLGRRWAILPGLIAEAIPGMGVFPVWVLVVLSIFVYDEITVRPKSRSSSASDRS